MMLAGDVVQNLDNPFDVNNDGFVTTRDAATVALRLALSGSAASSSASGEPDDNTGNVFYDVNGDGLFDNADFESLVQALNGSGEPGDVVTVQVQTTDLSGNVITSVDVGDEYILQVLVQDSQATEPPDGFGVFAAFLDVEFDSTLTSAAGSLEFGSDFTNQQQGDITTPGLIDETGGFANFTPLGNGLVELFSIRMQADAPGTVTFSSNAPEGGAAVETLVFGSGDAVDPGDILYGSASLEVVGEIAGDPDLAAFAKALADAGVELWTTTLNARSRIAEQLDLFEDGQQFLPIRELLQKAPDPDAPDQLTVLEPTPEADAEGRTRANVWVFPDQSESGGELLSLQQISDRSGVPIPTGTAPAVAPIEDVTVLQGSPLHIPLDGYDPNGDELTWTVSVGDPSAVSTFIPEGNRSVRLELTEAGTYLGDLVLELYEGRVPRATERFITLAEDSFYDDVIFHRVINEFMIQGGDPDGNGTGSSDLPDYDDQYDVDLQHNRSGVLSTAKTDDDTNNSQFFITEIPTRHLDFNHTIFGQLIEGERVRETVSNVAVIDGSVPELQVRMETVEIFEDLENAVVMLEALQGTGTTTVTVTATDPSGNSSSQTFNVTLEEDTFNAPPFLMDIEDQVFAVGETTQFQVDAIDVEGDVIVYDAAIFGNDNATIEVDENGLVTVGGFVGTLQVGVQVGPEDTSTVFASDPFDVQFFDVTIAADGPDSVDLLPITDSGAADDDNITNVTDLQFEVTGVVDGAVAVILADGVEVGRAVAAGETVVVTTANPSALGSGDHQITAAIEVDGALSLQTPAITVTLDQINPAVVSNTAPATASVGVDYVFDAEHEDEGTANARYSLGNAPTGMLIDDQTGEITWLPAASQVGAQNFDIVVTDLAGNSTSTPITVSVEDSGNALLSLQIVDADGNAISSIANGASFEVRVFVEDSRANPLGVSQAFVDLAFDAGLASVVTAGVSVGADFPDDVSTGTSSNGMVENVGGSTTTQLGGGQFLLATIPMAADAVGTLELDLSANANGVIFSGGVVPLAESSLTITDSAIDILPVATELTAVADAFSIDEDEQSTFDLLVNDQLGPNSGSIEITQVLGFTEGGSATISEDGRSVVYAPAADFFGSEQFSYTIRDSQGVLSSAEVTVTISSVNDAPTANDDFFPQDLPEYDPQRDGPTDPRLFLVEDSTEEVWFFVIQNDVVEPDVELATVSEATSTTGATVRVIEESLNTNVGYIPGPNVSGTDTFTYTFTDTGTPPLSDTATVSVEVLRRNDEPTVGFDTATVQSGRSVTIDASEILANDTAGPLEDDQTIEIVAVSGGTQGTAVLNSDGSITYTANAGATGTDTLTYTIRDNGVDDIFDDPTNDPSQISTVENFMENDGGRITLTIIESNSAPVAFNDSVSIVGGSSATVVNVLSNDSDPDAGPAAISVTSVDSTGTAGTVALVDGVVRYEPASGAVSGQDTFEYTITDGDLTSTATVTVTVTDPGTTTSSSFSGSVYFDVNNDGVMDADEQGIGGVVIMLDGTDDAGNTVSRETVTDSSGSYSFETLPKGTFTVTQQQSDFLLDGAETASAVSSSTGDDAFEVTVGDSIVTSSGNMFAERGLSPQYVILDLLSSSRGTEGFLTAVSNGQSQFVRSASGWAGFTAIQVSLSSDESQVFIDAVDSGGQNVRATVDASDSRVRLLGRDGDAMLIRIAAASSEFDFQPATASAAAVDAVFADA